MQGQSALASNNMFPSLTGIMVKLFYALLAGALAFTGGELLIKSGLIAGVMAAIATLAVEGLRTYVALRKERLAEFVTIEERAAMLRAEERKFLQSQIAYLEEVELTTRKRMHAMTAEVQRAILHIHLCEDVTNTMACHNCKTISVFTLPEFKVKTFDQIVEAFPLPESPHTPVR